MRSLSNRNTVLGLKNDIQVITGLEDKQKSTTLTIESDSTFDVEGISVQALKAPCHTRGHTLYRLACNLDTHNAEYDQEIYSNVLFTGDTLFSSGCGRFFEGNAAEMLQNMDKIASLPKDTKIFCGHEYTMSNLEWSLKVEPINCNLQQKYLWAK